VLESFRTKESRIIRARALQNYGAAVHAHSPLITAEVSFPDWLIKVPVLGCVPTFPFRSVFTALSEQTTPKLVPGNDVFIGSNVAQATPRRNDCVGAICHMTGRHECVEGKGERDRSM
jgi:hypothetical protein